MRWCLKGNDDYEHDYVYVYVNADVKEKLFPVRLHTRKTADPQQQVKRKLLQEVQVGKGGMTAIENIVMTAIENMVLPYVKLYQALKGKIIVKKK